MIELTDDYRKSARLFRERFGYGIPLSMIPQVIETDELIKKIEQCVEQGKDNLLESLGVSEDDGVLY